MSYPIKEEIKRANEDYDKYYSEYQLVQAGSSSVFLVQNSTGDSIKIIDDITTDNSTSFKNNINIITAKDYVAKDVIIQLNKTYKGKLILNRGAFENSIVSTLANMFTVYKQAGIIEEKGTLKAKSDTTNPNKFLVFYSYKPVSTAKYFDGTYALEV